MGEALKLERIWRFTTDDGEAKWEVDNNHVVEVGESLFVKLPRSAAGFAKLVFHKCDQVPKPLPRNYSLTASLGYIELQKLRNEKQSEDLLAQDQESVPAVFQHCAAPPKKKRATRQSLQEMRSKPQALELDIEGVPVKVLRPVHPRDDLCVELCAASIAHVIAFLQASGFSEGNMQKQRRQLSPDVPAGVWQRTTKKGTTFYLVPCKTAEGKVKYKSYRDVECIRVDDDEDDDIAEEVNPSDRGEMEIAVHAESEDEARAEADAEGEGVAVAEGVNQSGDYEVHPIADNS